MYNKIKPGKTGLQVNTSTRGEWIEEKVRRIVNNDEPIKDGAEGTYTEREEGVRPEMDPRTDKWDLAIEATEKAQKNTLSKREQRIGERTYDTMTEDQQKEFNTKFPKNKHAGKGGGEKTGGEGKA